MRLIYECPENFRESLTMPTATFPEIFNGLFFRLMLWICLQNLKFVALPVPGIIWVPKKCGQSLDTPMLPYLQNFNGLLFGCSLVNVPTKFEVRNFTRSWDLAIRFLGGGCELKIWGNRRLQGSAMVPFERVLVSSYRFPIVTFPLSLRVCGFSEILSLFLTPPLVSPNSSTFPWD